MSVGRTTDILYLLVLCNYWSIINWCNLLWSWIALLQVLPQWRDFAVHLHKC